jgi:hypothetical protein
MTPSLATATPAVPTGNPFKVWSRRLSRLALIRT